MTHVGVLKDILNEYGDNEYTFTLEKEALRAAITALAAQPAPGVGGDWQVFYLATIKALASMVNVHTPDKLFDLDAIPRDPIMEQVVRIRAAMDDYGKTLLSTRPAESVAQDEVNADG